MNTLNIITVWYNEENNLETLFSSLEGLHKNITVRHIYIDQTSTDNSLLIAKKYWCEVYLHTNKWYADPDKEWAVKNLIKSNEWVLICDADYYFSNNLKNELIEKINTNSLDAYWIKREDVFLWTNKIILNQLIFFKKWSVIITNEIHKYFKLNTDKVWYLKNKIISKDLKYTWNEIGIFMDKLNKYSQKEIEFIWDIWKYKTIFYIFFKPIIRFFWFWIQHKQFIRWTKWYILCVFMFLYQFLIYTKLYEKFYLNNPVKDEKR